MAIVKYHLFDMDEYAAEIRKGLETKVEAAYRRGLYSDYKTKADPKEREQARQKYLDERGVPEERLILEDRAQTAALILSKAGDLITLEEYREAMKAGR